MNVLALFKIQISWKMLEINYYTNTIIKSHNGEILHSKNKPKNIEFREEMSVAWKHRWTLKGTEWFDFKL